MKKHVKWLLLALSLVCLAGAAGRGSKQEEEAAATDTFSTEDEILAEYPVTAKGDVEEITFGSVWDLLIRQFLQT